MHKLRRLVKSNGKSSSAKAASSFGIDQDEMNMRRDVEQQCLAAKALQTYVHEVLAGFQTLLRAHEKFRDGAMKDLHDVGQLLEIPIDNFARVVRHIQEVASQTTVGLQVHQQKLVECRTELARADNAAEVSAATSKGRSRHKAQKDEEGFTNLIHAAKVQQAYARFMLEACATRRERLVDLAQKSVEAVARTVSEVDGTVAVAVLDMTARSGLPVTSYTSDVTRPWNPFSRESSDSVVDTTVGSGVSQQGSDISSTNLCVTSEQVSAEKVCANNPFSADLAEPARMTRPPLAPSEKQAQEECAGNPFNEDCAQVAHKDRSLHNDAFVQPPMDVFSSPSEEQPFSL